MFPCPGTLKQGENPAQLHAQGPLQIMRKKIIQVNSSHFDKKAIYEKESLSDNEFI